MKWEEERKYVLLVLWLLVRILNLVQVQEEIYECFKAGSSDWIYVFKKALWLLFGVE